MQALIEYWPLIIVIIAAIAVGGYAIYSFVHRPTTEQITKVKEWLLYACTEAQKQLGSGTGQIKLRYVYDQFLTKFPYLAKIIPFDLFSKLVDEVLDKFRNLLQTNNNVKAYVEATPTPVPVTIEKKEE